MEGLASQLKIISVKTPAGRLRRPVWRGLQASQDPAPVIRRLPAGWDTAAGPRSSVAGQESAATGC
jgi:hypothetical protein